MKLTHIPYKGGAPALQDLVGGHVQAYFGNPAEFMSHIDGGNIRVLATSGETRMEELPSVPTLSETIPGLSLITWNGLSFRKGTPKADVDHVSQAVQKISKEPAYVEGLKKFGVAAIGNTPEEFDAAIKRDRLLWNEAIEIADIKQQ